HRRSLHSPGARKPLRSSPLAGPALQADGTTPEGTETGKARPSRISSTPDFASLLTPLPSSKRARPKTAENPQAFSPLPAAQFTVQKPLISPVSHSLLKGNLVKQGSVDLKRPASVVQPSLSSSPSSWVLRTSPTTINPENSKVSPLPPAARRPKTAHGYPSLPQCFDSNEPSSNNMPLARTRDSRDNSWYIANPYEMTPKFSRLGLASSNVVLPVSAKERKRVVHQTSKSSIKMSTARMGRADSSPDTSSLASQQDTLSLPTSSLMRAGSSSSTSDSLASLHLRETTAPISATSTINTTAEGDQSDHRHEPSLKPNPINRSVPFSTPKEGPLTRLKVLTLRSIRSCGSLNKSQSAPINDKLSTDATQPQSEIKLGFVALRSDSPSSDSSTESDTGDLKRAQGYPSRKSSGVKKLWKAITAWQRSFS
ncbi:hypothetical protein AN958_05954, partial [Leucoagaricus sp. SymC.cos]